MACSEFSCSLRLSNFKRGPPPDRTLPLVLPGLVAGDDEEVAEDPPKVPSSSSAETVAVKLVGVDVRGTGASVVAVVLMLLTRRFLLCGGGCCGMWWR